VRSPVIVGVALAYFAVIVAISVWATRRTRTASDFFVAGHGIGLAALTVASVSTSVSGFAFIGGPGAALQRRPRRAVHHPAGVGDQRAGRVGAGEAHAAPGRGARADDGARRHRRALPVAAAQGLSAVAILFGIVGYMATNCLAMGYVLDAIFGIGVPAGIWIGTGVTLAYSVAGGILAGSTTTCSRAR
jgi:Na+/proline symporter